MRRWPFLVSVVLFFGEASAGENASLNEHYAVPLAVVQGVSSLKNARALEQAFGVKIDNYFSGDLNGDGIDDYVLAGNYRSSGADFAIVDGRDRQVVARGSCFQLFKVPVKVNSWPTLLCLRRDGSSPKVLMLGTLVFDGREYVTVSLVTVTEEAFAKVITEVPSKP